MATWLDMIRWNGETGAPGQYQVIRPISGSSGGDDTGLLDTLTALVDTLKGPKIDAEMQRWLTAVNAWIIDEEAWLDQARIWSELPEGVRDGPPPAVPPKMPPLTDFISLPALLNHFGPWGIVVWVGVQVVRRVLETWVEKRMNPGNTELIAEFQRIREILKAGLLYNVGSESILKKALLFDDGQYGANQSIFKAGLLFKDVYDNHLKGALDRGLIKEIIVMEGETPVKKMISTIELLKMSVDDLAFVDAVVDFGAFRVHIRGKMIEY